MGHLPVLQEGGAKALCEANFLEPSQVTVLFRRVGLGSYEGDVLEAWLGGPSVLVGPTVWSLPVVCFSRFQR